MTSRELLRPRLCLWVRAEGTVYDVLFKNNNQNDKVADLKRLTRAQGHCRLYSFPSSSQRYSERGRPVGTFTVPRAKTRPQPQGPKLQRGIRRC